LWPQVSDAAGAHRLKGARTIAPKARSSEETVMSLVIKSTLLTKPVAARRAWPLEWLALLSILCVGAARDAALLGGSAAAVGIDGYYYVLQVNSLNLQGVLHYPTGTPVVLYLLSGFSRLVGDTVLAIKVGGLVLNTLLCAGSFALVTSLTRRAWYGVLASGMAAFSGLHLYLLGEYVNSLGALTMLVWCAWAAVRAVQTRRLGWAIVSAALLLTALWSHRLTPTLVQSMLASALLARWATYEGETSQRYRRAALAAGLLLLCAPILLAAQPFVGLPSWLRGELLVAPRWPLRRIDLGEGLLLLLAAPATIYLAVRRGVTESKFARAAFVTVAVWCLLIPLNPYLNHDTAFQGTIGRLGSLIYIPAAILLPGLLWLSAPLHRRAGLLVLAACAASMLLSVMAPLPHGLRPEYRAGRESLIRQLPAQRALLCETPLVIAQHGEQFVVTALLGVPSQQRPPSEARYGCVYWLLHHVPQSVLPGGQNVLDADGFGRVTAFVSDEDLRLILRDAPDEARRQVVMSNPHLREVVRQERARAAAPNARAAARPQS
jgi:hypothetical protein